MSVMQAHTQLNYFEVPFWRFISSAITSSHPGKLTSFQKKLLLFLVLSVDFSYMPFHFQRHKEVATETYCCILSFFICDLLERKKILRQSFLIGRIRSNLEASSLI